MVSSPPYTLVGVGYPLIKPEVQLHGGTQGYTGAKQLQPFSTSNLIHRT